MNVPTKRFIWALLAIPLLVFAASVYGIEDTSSGPLVPEGLIIEDVFKPGIGSPVGKVVAVRGEVLIVHEGVLRGYRAQKDLPLFTGDTIIALERGRIKFELNDGSALTLIPETKLTINESVYDPNEKDRSAYINVSVGKVRSVVTKLSGYKRSVFKVETPTAVCGVRGSDFITLAMVNISEITALEDTALGVLSKDFPEEPPLLITDFEMATVERGKRPLKEKISREKAEQLKKEFLFLPELIERGGEEEVVEKPGEKYEEEGILVPEYEPVKPDPLERPERPSARHILDREGVAGEHKHIDVPLKKLGVAEAGQTFTNSIDMKFVLIPAGTFTMGSSSNERKRDDDEQLHRVTISKPFYMQSTEVTVGQWRAFVRDSGYKSEAETKAHIRTGNKWEKKTGYYWDNPGFSQSDSHPVTCVSWNDAYAFVTWLNRKECKGHRLPTEAEWEYACRAGTDTPFYFGDCLSTDQANYNGNHPMPRCAKGEYRERTLPVGSFQPNTWGLYDMHGNVWEWCQDWYQEYPSGHVTDSTGPSSGQYRVLRGGSWKSNASSTRSANRNGDNPDGGGYFFVGFRVAKTL